MEEKRIALVTFSEQSAFYFDLLLDLRERATWFFTDRHKPLIVPFVITCAAALECILNDCLIREFRGTKHFEAQLDGYLSMTLKGKLINVVPAITAQRFAINQDHKAFQHLIELIRIRNKLVHNRSSVFEEHTAIVKTMEGGKPMIAIPESLDLDREKHYDYTFGIPGDVGRFHDALEDFYNKFVAEWDPEEFKANDLIVKAEKPPSIPTFVIKDQ